MNGRIMWSERFVNDDSYKMLSYCNVYEVWIPIEWNVEPTEEMIARIETVARKALDTNPEWKVKSCGPSLRWISARSFERVHVIRHNDLPDGHIKDAYVVISETESICD
jgi:hypothetical protein